MLLQTLRLLESIDVAAMDPLGPDFVHTLVEALKLGFADREVFYGDPDAVDVPLATLLSTDLCGRAPQADRRARLDGVQAGRHRRRAGAHAARARDGRQGRRRSAPAAANRHSRRLPAEWGDTVHLDVVDAAGNMISATPSGGWLQGSPVVPGLGFPISTRGQMCWLEDGHPTTLRPGTRPRITLSPTLVTRDGEPYLAIGTPGGDQQEQWTLTVLLRHVHHRMSLQQAIDAPMFQSKHMVQSFHPRPFEPGRVVIEDRFPAATRAELESARAFADGRGSLGARARVRGRPLGRVPARRRDAAADAGIRGGAVAARSLRRASRGRRRARDLIASRECTWRGR